MKTTLILVTLAITGSRGFCEGNIPKKWGKERYQETVASSPFVLETQKAPPEPEKPKDEVMFINAISTAEEKPHVVIQRVGEGAPVRYTLGERGEDGVLVTDIKMGETFKTTKVEIEQNGKRRFIEFNESAPVAAPAAIRPPGGPGGGGRMMQPPSITPTINTGAAPKPQVPTPGATIPRPTNAQNISVPRPGGAGGQPSFRGSNGGSNSGRGGGDSRGGDPSGQSRVRVRTIDNR